MAQPWGPFPNFVEYYQNGQPINPATSSIAIDYTAVLYTNFFQYRLKAITNYGFSNEDWITPGSIALANFPTIAPVPLVDNMNYWFTPEFQNLTTLSPGWHTFSISFQTQGRTANGMWVDISNYIFTIKILIGDPVAPLIISITPSDIVFNYSVGASKPSALITVNDTNWKMQIPIDKFDVELLTTSVLPAPIAQPEPLNPEFIFFDGIGDGVLKITLSNYWDSPGIQNDVKTGEFLVFNSKNEVNSIPYLVILSQIEDFVTSTMFSKPIVFSLSNEFFLLRTVNPNSYFEAKATIEVFSQGELKTITINQKLLPFKGKTKLFLLKTIHNLIDRPEGIWVGQSIFNDANLYLTCEERDLTTDQLLQSVVLNPIRIIAGLNLTAFPIFLGGGYDPNQLASRVTPNSLYNFYLRWQIDCYFTITKNNVVQTSQVYISESQNNFTIEFNDSIPGDIITYELKNKVNDDIWMSKTFKVFPVGKHSNHIYWLSDFLVQSVIEFTGRLIVKNDYDYLHQKTTQDGVLITNPIHTQKESKIIINTGWILPSDVASIDSIMRSKQVYIILNFVQVQIIPIPKSLLIIDTDRDLVEFSLEFIINKNYNEENYSL